MSGKDCLEEISDSVCGTISQLTDSIRDLSHTNTIAPPEVIGRIERVAKTCEIFADVCSERAQRNPQKKAAFMNGSHSLCEQCATLKRVVPLIAEVKNRAPVYQRITETLNCTVGLLLDMVALAKETSVPPQQSNVPKKTVRFSPYLNENVPAAHPSAAPVSKSQTVVQKPVPNPSTSQPKKTLLNPSTSQPKRPLPSPSTSQPKRPLPSPSTSQPKKPLPSPLTSQPKSTLPQQVKSPFNEPSKPRPLPAAVSPKETSFCSQCGMKLPASSRFCPGCGTRVEAPAAAAPKPDAKPAEPKPAAAPAPAPAAKPDAKPAEGEAAAPSPADKYLCPGCGKLPSGAMAKVLDRMWHVSCFKCQGCGNPISGAFNMHEDKPYCQECFKLKCAKKCDKCGQPITAGMLVAGDKYFHTECFVCSKCGGSARDGYKFKDGELICAKCLSIPAPK